MRITLATLAAIALIGSILLAQSGASKTPSSRASTSAKASPSRQTKPDAPCSAPATATADDAVEAKLDTKIEKVDFKEAKLSTALEFLSQEGGISMVVKWELLTAAGIDRIAAVNVHLRNVTLRKALQAVLDLDYVGGANPLTYEVEGGAVTVSTTDDLAKHMVTRAYDVRDIMLSAHNSFAENEHLWSDDSLGVRVPTNPTDYRERDLETVIAATVDRDSWSVTGTGLGLIVLTNGRLIVTQTKWAHRKIAALIEMLREPQGQPVGIAGVRVDSADAAKELQSLVAARPADMEAALRDGEDKGKWSLDKCDSEQYGVQCVNQTCEHRVQHGITTTTAPAKVPTTAPATEPAVAPETVLEHRVILGYQAAVVGKGHDGDATRLSVTCESAWIPKDASCEKDTPECNTSIYHRHHIFEIDLKPGEAKVFPVIPVTAKDGGVMVVVYLPRK